MTLNLKSKFKKTLGDGLTDPIIKKKENRDGTVVCGTWSKLRLSETVLQYMATSPL
jgi:hypothetical protein